MAGTAGATVNVWAPFQNYTEWKAKTDADTARYREEARISNEAYQVLSERYQRECRERNEREVAEIREIQSSIVAGTYVNNARDSLRFGPCIFFEAWEHFIEEKYRPGTPEGCARLRAALPEFVRSQIVTTRGADWERSVEHPAGQVMKVFWAINRYCYGSGLCPDP